MARLILTIWLCLMAAPIWAQVWQMTTADDGHYVYFRSGANAGVDLYCLAPSLQFRPAIEVGAHEEKPMSRDVTRLEIGSDRVSTAQSLTRTDVVLWADQTGYRLPPIQWNELNGIWELDLAASDPLWSAIASARALILAPGQEQPWQLPVADLAESIASVQGGCRAAWDAAERGAAVPQGGQVVALPPAIPNRVRVGCNAPAAVPAQAVQAGDLDRDGTPDFVLDWGAIACPGALSRPFCGAANCSHEVFLSSRGYANPVDFLGTTLVIVNHRSGGLALVRGATYSVCGANNEYCASPYVWDGARFVEQP